LVRMSVEGYALGSTDNTLRIQDTPPLVDSALR
jgi:hypothetical protein